jgi:uncharacterized RDD family membrane protein YckC
MTAGTSTTIPTLPYFSSQPHTCPLCHKRPVWKKMIYGHPVCKKCFYAFANRRQLGYLVDSLIVTVPNIFLNLALVAWMRQLGLHGVGLQMVSLAFALPVMCLFIMKDGFHGQSPGKWLTNVLVLDDSSNQPIGFEQSFKRNSILLLGLIPFVGGLASLVVILIIAAQVAKGYRLGDRFAHTRVI